jgi:STE24 endopeptidase
LSLVAAAQEIAVPASSAAAVAYQAVSDRFWIADQLAAPVLAAALLFTGTSARLRSALARRLGARPNTVVAAFAAIFIVLVQLLRAPVDYFWKAAYAQLTGAPPPSPGAWLASFAGDSLLLLAIFVAGACVLHALMRRSPGRWWIVAAAAGSTLALVALLGQPWTRSYTSVVDTPVANAVAAVASRVGVPLERIGIEHVDDTTGCGAATVIGLGPTRLMLLDDTLVRNYPEREVVQTVAHESSHFVHDDNVKALVIISAWLLAAVSLVQLAGRWILSWASDRLGFASLADPAALPLVVLILCATYLLVLPWERAFQREGIEHRADRFALDITHDNASEAMLNVKDMKCYPSMTATPSAFFQLFRATHPSVEQRIVFANRYHPWRTAP